jgi:hypothetical protein
MSPSEKSTKLSALLAELRGQIERAIQAGEVGVAPEDLTNLVSGAVKLYATAVEEDELDVPVIDGTVSTTEAMVVACALLRAHHLNPFDLALWFSRTAPNAR